MGLFQTTVIVLLAHHVFDLNKVIDYFVPVYVLLAALVIASYALHFQMHPRKEHPPVFRLAKKQPEKKKDLGGRPDFNGVWKTTRSEKYAEFLTAQVRVSWFCGVVVGCVLTRKWDADLRDLLLCCLLCDRASMVSRRALQRMPRTCIQSLWTTRFSILPSLALPASSIRAWLLTESRWRRE